MSLVFYFITLFCLLGISFQSVAKPNEPKTRSYDKDLSDTPHSVDGDHSSIYDHEAFLGREEAKRFDDLTPDESKKRLGEIIDKIDQDHDGKITEQEMSSWISKISKKMIIEDVNRAWKEYGLADGDKLSWKRHSEEMIGQNGEYEDEDEETKIRLLEKDERRWKQADSDKDGNLSKDEVLSFLHPEHDPKMRSIIIKETLDEVDKNKDGFIDLEEYISDLWSPTSDDEPEPQWVQSEREEFAKRRDKNGDGKLDEKEIGDWIVPEQFDYIDAEVKHLFSQSDDDKDGVLTKNEILNRYDLFVGSQATNFGEILTSHDEL